MSAHVALSIQWRAYWLDGRGSIHGRGRRFFSSPYLGPIQPPPQWVPGSVSPA